MNKQNKAHATIVGAGIVGVSCAAFLQREGYSVTVIDRLPPGEGCSFGNAGGVVTASVMPEFHLGVVKKLPLWMLDPLGPLRIRWGYFPKALPWFLQALKSAVPARSRAISEARAALSMRTLQDYDWLLKSAGIRHMLNAEDGIRLYDNARQFAADARSRQVHREYGFTQTQLSPEEIRELEPDIAPGFYCAMTYGGWNHLTNPSTVVKKIAESVERDGGEFLCDDVVRAEHDGERAITLHLKEQGSRSVDRLVVAAGAYSHLLAAQLGSKVLLEAERGYHLTIPDPGISISRCVTHAGKPMGITPMDVGLRLAGTDEFAGTEAPPDWRRADILWKVGKRLFPNLRELDDNVSRWMGRRPGMPDSVPVIAPSPKLENVWFAFGHGHLGITWGPTTGRMISEMIAGKPANTDLSPYRVDRF